MATHIKKSKPTSPGRRFRSWVSRDGLHKGILMHLFCSLKNKNQVEIIKEE